MDSSTLTYHYLEIPETRYLEEEIITKNITASYITHIRVATIPPSITYVTYIITYVKGLCDICDVSALAFLVSRPKILTDSAKLLSAVHSYLGGLGLRRLEDYMIELSIWADAEIEGWSKPQIVVKLLESGLRKISEKKLDEFKLLENMLRIASEIVSREILTEILISVE